MSAGYDFGQLYGQANMTGMLRIPEAEYDMLCTKAEWGRSKDGTKGQWTVEMLITTGEHAGTKLSNVITINPVKNDGSPNPNGLGMMFRDLAAFGVPIPVPPGWDEPGIARFMVGKPVTGQVKDDEYDGETRSKIRRFAPPRPGAPTQQSQNGYAPQNGYGPQGSPYAQNGQNGYGQDPYAQPYSGSMGGYPQQGQPAAPSWGGPEQQPGQPPQQTAPGPWQGAPAQVPGAPEWAQPAQPGQGGMAEFTPQGQSYQPGYGQQPPYGGPGGGYNVQPGAQGGPGYPPPGRPEGYGAPAQGAPAPGAPYQQGAPSPSDQGQPAMPPWAQAQGQTPPPPGVQAYQGGQQGYQPGPANPPPADPNAAPPPPWAQ
jgi:hypothetical protein